MQSPEAQRPYVCMYVLDVGLGEPLYPPQIFLARLVNIWSTPIGMVSAILATNKDNRDWQVMVVRTCGQRWGTPILGI